VGPRIYAGDGALQRSGNTAQLRSCALALANLGPEFFRSLFSRAPRSWIDRLFAQRDKNRYPTRLSRKYVVLTHPLTYIIRETPSLRCLADEVGGKVVVAVL
jgi:hypothetical protein